MNTQTLDPQEAFAQQVKASSENSEPRYRELVLRAADGDLAQVEEIGQACLAAGRTLEDFQKHLEAATARKQAAADMDQSAQFADRLPDLQGQMQEANEAVSKAEKEHREKMRPLLGKLIRCRDEEKQVRSDSRSLKAAAIHKLSETVSAEHRREFAGLSNHKGDLSLALGKAKQSIRGLDRNALAGEVERITYRIVELESRPNSVLAVNDLRAELAAVQKSLQAVIFGEQRITDIEAEQVKADAAIEQHEAALLDWRNMNFESEEAAREAIGKPQQSIQGQQPAMSV